FLLSAAPVAVHRPAPCRLRRIGVAMPAVAHVARFAEPLPEASAFAADVLAGLKADPKRLPAKYFYDSAGSHLFERITTLPEYYPTRTELGILQAHAADIAALMPADGAVVEFGSGANTKASLLLRAAPHIKAYVPVDICGDMLREEAETLRHAFPQ